MPSCRYDSSMKTLKRFLFKHDNFIAKILAVTLLIGMFYHAGEQFLATDAENKKQQAEEGLQDVENEIENIENQQQNLNAQIDQTRNELSALIQQQNVLKSEIEGTQVEIEQTKLDLELAKEEEKKQYEAMKIRLQYMYESASSDNVWSALLESDGITDFLNRMEYITNIYNADRQLTDQYKQIVAEVEEKEEQLLAKMNELLAKQETFLGQQAEIESMLAELEDTRSEFAEALAAAEAQAAAYRSTIEEQNEIIRQEQEKKRQEEEAKKRKEEEAKKNESASTSTPSQSGQGVTGQDVVNYAMQFVGNPYVWGGNSLTNGCDCSGFVHLVYKHFGYNTVRYSMSFLYEGVAVSRDDVRVGDIVVYAIKNGIGHVAIYAGNGKIVEAQSSSTGITAYRSIDCREIVGIRRLIP